MGTIRPDARGLYMSACAAEALRREGLDEGELALLPKPFSVGELVARVSEALEGEDE